MQRKTVEHRGIYVSLQGAQWISNISMCNERFTGTACLLFYYKCYSCVKYTKQILKWYGHIWEWRGYTPLHVRIKLYVKMSINVINHDTDISGPKYHRGGLSCHGGLYYSSYHSKCLKWILQNSDPAMLQCCKINIYVYVNHISLNNTFCLY